MYWRRISFVPSKIPVDARVAHGLLVGLLAHVAHSARDLQRLVGSVPDRLELKTLVAAPSTE